MSFKFRTIALGAAALASSLTAPAQTAPPESASPPVAGVYNSAFEGYRPFEAQEVADWRKSNDTVREIGGWRAYAREIQGAANGPVRPGAATGPASVAPAPVARPVDPHPGHQR